MNSEQPEYNCDTNPYPSFGKKYNGEKAIISLTSWEKRINTVAKTLYSLLTQCKGFHIVLVLSEEEFPKMMNELPENLKLFVDNELIEVLWVYKNYKSFKKVLFTMDKYKTVPVISADDDCIYTCNYAQMLYDVYEKNPSTVVTLDGATKNNIYWCRGSGTLYPKNTFNTNEFHKITNEKENYNDDAYMAALIMYKKKTIISLTNFHFNMLKYMRLHDEISALSATQQYKEIPDIMYFYNKLISL